MKPNQERYFPDSGIRYELSLEYFIENAPPEVHGEINIDIDQSHKDRTIDIKGPESLKILCHEKINDTKIRSEFYLNASDDHKVILLPSGANRSNGVHIDIPSSNIHTLSEELLTSDKLETTFEAIEDHFDESGETALSSFIGESSSIVYFSEFIQILNIFCRQNRRFRHFIYDDGANFFIRRILNPRNSYYIKSPQDLITKCQEYSSYESLPVVEWNDAMSLACRELSHWGDPQIPPVLQRVLLTGEEDVEKQIQPKLFYQVLSLLVRADCIEEAMAFAEVWERDDSEEKPRPSNEEGLLEIDTIEEFYTYAAKSFFEAGEEIGDEMNDTVSALPMFEAASSLYATIDDQVRSMKAKYEYKIARGEELSSRKIDRAMNEYDEAVKIAKRGIDSKIFDEDDIIDAKINKVHSLSRYRRSSDPQRVIKTIDEEIEEVNNILDPDVEFDERIEVLYGERCQAYSQIALDSRDFELAINHLEEAEAHFAKAQRESMKAWAVLRKKEIEAIVYEKLGKFDSAADCHSVAKSIAYNEFDAHNVGKFHNIRTIMCKCKYLILDGEYQTAYEELQGAEENLGGEQREGPLLQSLLRCLLDYKHGGTTPTQEIPSQKRVSESDERPSFTFDYSQVFNKIRAYQELGQKSQTTDEELLQVYLEDAFLPISAESRGAEAEYAKQYISITTSNWRDKIPVELNRNLEDIQMKEALATSDSSELGIKLLRILENYLELSVDYYATRTIGDDWKMELFEKEELTFGHLVQAAEKLDELQNTYSIISEPILESEDLVDLRNTLVHTIKDLSDGKYEKLNEKVLSALEELAKVAPIRAEVISQTNIELSALEIDCAGANNQAWLDSNIECSNDILLPPSALQDGRIIEIDNPKDLISS